MPPTPSASAGCKDAECKAAGCKAAGLQAAGLQAAGLKAARVALQAAGLQAAGLQAARVTRFFWAQADRVSGILGFPSESPTRCPSTSPGAFQNYGPESACIPGTMFHLSPRSTRDPGILRIRVKPEDTGRAKTRVEPVDAASGKTYSEPQCARDRCLRNKSRRTL